MLKIVQNISSLSHFGAATFMLTFNKFQDPPETSESTPALEAATSEPEVVQHDEVVHEEVEHQPQHHQIPTQMVLQTSEGQHIQVLDKTPVTNSGPIKLFIKIFPIS